MFLAETRTTVYTCPWEKVKAVPVLVQLEPHAEEIRTVAFAHPVGENGPGADDQLVLAY